VGNRQYQGSFSINSERQVKFYQDTVRDHASTLEMARTGASRASVIKQAYHTGIKKVPTTTGRTYIKSNPLQAKQVAVNQGFDVGSAAESALSGVPFVGPIASNLLSQSGILKPKSAPTGGAQGGRSRGVQLIDASTGLNLGVISRKRALSVLTSHKKGSSTKPRRMHPPDCRCGRCY
jgi:hypothetical protein